MKLQRKKFRWIFESCIRMDGLCWSKCRGQLLKAHIESDISIFLGFWKADFTAPELSLCEAPASSYDKVYTARIWATLIKRH